MVAALCLLGVGVYRIEIDTDITKSLPAGDPVLEDAGRLLERHPLQDRVVMDLAVDGKAEPDLLVEAADFIEGELRESGLFRTVGMDDMAHLGPGLMMHVVDNLPLLFSSDELEERIQPLLAPETIRARLRDAMGRLGRLDGIGQVRLMEADPLEFRTIVLARLASLSPSSNARIYRGKLLSLDGRRLLIMAHPLGSGADTVFAGRLTGLIRDIAARMDGKYEETGRKLTLTPVGAYRAALDNERTAKADTQRAILFSFIGVALLLILAFPRPLLGLLALVPAMAGTVMAFFIFSLLYEKASILAIGFGGAIISITVDHGIAFLMFLDRTRGTRGKEAAREVWAVGLLAALTSVGAFSFLTFSGFDILAQIGLFAGLGIAWAFLFVHAFFPMIFPNVSPARARRPLPLRTAVNKLALAGGKYKAWAALGLALFFLPFAKPVFHVDLRSMNTVSPETKAAESRVSEAWGNVFSRVFMMVEADDMAELRERGDRMTDRIEADLKSGALSSAFAPAMVFPGPARAKRDLAAWKAFWSREDAAFKEKFRSIATELGFAENAFAPFLKKLDHFQVESAAIPEDFFPLLGIAGGADGAGWIQFSTLTPGPAYDAARFYSTRAGIDGVRVFDPRYFSERLGDHLTNTFIKMASILAPMAAVLLLIFFMDVTLTLVALAPMAFAFICTLGALNITGRGLDIPGLMLSIIVFGMGVDYALFFVRAHQRYHEPAHPGLGLVRTSVFLASASTLIGFGSLALADHSLLRGAGRTAFLGIGFSLLGAFAILPPLLTHLYAPARLTAGAGSRGRKARAARRYRHLAAVQRLAARRMIRLDPLFTELPELVGEPDIVLDIGAGRGVPAVCLLESFPRVRVFGVDPDPERTRIAARVVGDRGAMAMGRAPDLPDAPGPADAAIMIDMVHLLSDDQLRHTFVGLRHRLRPGGRLVIRTPDFAGVGPSLSRRMLNAICRIEPRRRSAQELEEMIAEVGFASVRVKHAGSREKKIWIQATAKEPM